MKWAPTLLLIPLLAMLYTRLTAINHTFYRLTPHALNATVQQSLIQADTTLPARLQQGFPPTSETNMTHLLSILIPNLTKDHPQLLWNTNWQDPSEWFFNNAGGAMGSMFILHSSMTEYVIVFGSAIGTEGHSGRHTADNYFHILQGQESAYEAGKFEREIYSKGDVNHMKRGVVKQYGMIPETWALEYSCGWIPLMLPFGFADGIFSTNDVITLYHTVRITGREMIRNLLAGKV
nr:C-8 sterol isomerase [Cryptococcus depauperatus CBS 7855]